MKIIKKGGTLRFFGDWFGRPYDNFHIPVSAELSENVLTILFNNGGKCVVYDPVGTVNEPNDFHVGRASKIVWEWYYYGKAQTPENLCRLEYTFADGSVSVVNNGVCKAVNRSVDADSYALEMC